MDVHCTHMSEGPFSSHANYICFSFIWFAYSGKSENVHRSTSKQYYSQVACAAARLGKNGQYKGER